MFLFAETMEYIFRALPMICQLKSFCSTDNEGTFVIKLVQFL